MKFFPERGQKKSNWFNQLILRVRCCSKSGSLQKYENWSSSSLSSNSYFADNLQEDAVHNKDADLQDTLTMDSNHSYIMNNSSLPTFNSNINKVVDTQKTCNSTEKTKFVLKPHHNDLFESIFYSKKIEYVAKDDNDNHMVLDVPKKISFLNEERMTDGNFCPCQDLNGTNQFCLSHKKPSEPPYCNDNASTNKFNDTCFNCNKWNETDITKSPLYQWAEMKIDDDFTKASIRSVLGIYYKDARITDMEEFLTHAKSERLDPGIIFFGNLKHFMNLLIAFENAWSNMTKNSNDMEMIANLQSFDFNNYFDDVEDANVGNDGDLRQRCIDGTYVSSLDELYESAELAKEPFYDFAKRMREKCGIPIEVEPSLKERDRANLKLKENYSSRRGPPAAWLFDVVRGKAICSTVIDIVHLWGEIMEDENAVVTRLKNRCITPNSNGSRDLLLNIRLPIGKNSFHVCELQIQIREISNIDKELNSHITYEFFRSYFKGNCSTAAINKDQLDILLEYGGDVESAEEFVDNALLEADWESLHEIEKIMKMLYKKNLQRKISQKLSEMSHKKRYLRETSNMPDN